MYQYTWDPETGGILLTSEISKLSNEPRPVYYKELDILGFDKYWQYPKDDSAPIMWAETNNYVYKGRTIARIKGGSLDNAPELIVIDDSDKDIPLKAVDIEKMVKKNHALMDTLIQETIKQVYNTYLIYRNKVDVFYVAFSGGKDSLVVFDIVQKALPHDQFMVLFGDTQMEFPDTYKTAEIYEKYCNDEGIPFIHACSDYNAVDLWKKFGPPATICRWCCSALKTTPQILALKKETGKRNFTGMAIVGVRADESASRSGYEEVSFEKKHQGQYNFNAILNWNSAEIYLYIFMNNLYLNPAYKKGNRRVGCLLCPRAAERSEYFARINYPNEIKRFTDVLYSAYTESFANGERLEEFIQNGGWKARKSARDITGIIRFQDEITDGKLIIHVYKPCNDWKEWIKTLGVLISENGQYTIKFRSNAYAFQVIENERGYDVIINESIVRENPQFIKCFKNVFRKAAYCVGCRECEANCHNGYITIENGQVTVSDKCVHCLQCHEIELGCLVAASRKLPKEGHKMISGSLNRYSHHAPKMVWFEEFFRLKDDFEKDNVVLGSKMMQYFKMFLRDSKLLENGKFSEFAGLIESIGLNNEAAWALMLVNLAYTAQINWFVTETEFSTITTKDFVILSAIEAGTPEGPAKDVWASLTRFTELPFGKIGLGEAITTNKKDAYITRTPWSTPIPEVILYSLYQFAEHCGEYYQFTLSTLMDDTIERDGVSPTRIFGLDEDTMKRILNGLAVNYPDFISVSFTLDLDNITLRPEKSSMDVLKLF